MVRLRLPGNPSRPPGNQVSIPLWCDCDPSANAGARPRIPKFQSHYGAIATSHTPNQPAQGIWFQSHYGAIATSNVRIGPYGVEQVSIPLWCDCDGEWPAGEPGGALRFQSHYGAIATHESRMVSRIRARFNPTMVRLRPCKWSSLAQESQVSIPLWCDCDRA